MPCRLPQQVSSDKQVAGFSADNLLKTCKVIFRIQDARQANV